MLLRNFTYLFRSFSTYFDAHHGGQSYLFDNDCIYSYTHLHRLFIGAAIVICAGCSITSHYGVDPPEWDYKCPEFVTEADNEYCHEYAYDKASHVLQDTAGSDAFSNTAILLGLLVSLGELLMYPKKRIGSMRMRLKSACVTKVMT